MNSHQNHTLTTFVEQAHKVILGKDHELQLALCCFLSDGHLLIEDVPGVGKTTFAKTMAKLLDLSFSRIQFTNDLMPSDLLGVHIYDNQLGAFKLVPGAVFNQFVLVDELNRGTAKTQSALLEAMEEHQVTLDGKTISLPEPFFVVATQNPRSQIGTHHLPESQLDRFMMKMKMGYPAVEYELKLISHDQHLDELKKLGAILNFENIKNIKNSIEQVRVSEKLLTYVLSLLETSRAQEQFLGLSPRAGRDIVRAAKTWAYLEKRDFVLPDDVQAVLPAVVVHRLSPFQGQSFDQDLELVSSLIAQTHVD